MFEGQSVDLGGLSKQEKINMVSQQESMMAFFNCLKLTKKWGLLFLSFFHSHAESVYYIFLFYILSLFLHECAAFNTVPESPCVNVLLL